MVGLVKSTYSVSPSRLTLLYHLRSRNGISYVALMMDKNDKLFAKKGRGRPTREQSEQLVLHGELKEEIKN